MGLVSMGGLRVGLCWVHVGVVGDAKTEMEEGG